MKRGLEANYDPLDSVKRQAMMGSQGGLGGMGSAGLNGLAGFGGGMPGDFVGMSQAMGGLGDVQRQVNPQAVMGELLSQQFSAKSGNDAGSGVYPRRPGEDPCAFYIRTGTCKFGEACKFDHPPKSSGGGGAGAQLPTAGGPGPSPTPNFSFTGINVPATSLRHPRRPGAEPCAFFMKTGECKFGPTCKFDHPTPGGGGSGVGGPSGPPPVLDPLAAAAAVLAQNPLMNSIPGGMNAVMSALQQQALQAQQALLPAARFPQRPGEPECSFFLKTGDCKYGPGCKFHHPLAKAAIENDQNKKDRAPCQFYAKQGSCAYGAMCRFRHASAKTLEKEGVSVADLMTSFPRNPDEKICSFYQRTGKCAYGMGCKYDHPPRQEEDEDASEA